MAMEKIDMGLKLFWPVYLRAITEFKAHIFNRYLSIVISFFVDSINSEICCEVS